MSSGTKKRFRLRLERLQSTSLRCALKEQGLWPLYARLGSIVPDLKDQYSTFKVDSEFLLLKVRGMHAFQMALLSEAIGLMGGDGGPFTIVDIGDSAGTHLQYLRELHKDRQFRCLSVNLDAEAVQRIRAKGLEAVQSCAEEVATLGINADMFVSFEMLEHLANPVQFLKDLSYQTTCRALVITVPYVAESRVGLHKIRNNVEETYGPENTHIFELSPSDWTLLFLHAGWRIKEARLYRQYPRGGMLRSLKPIWRMFDFEGFWGAILEREHTWSDRYQGDCPETPGPAPGATPAASAPGHSPQSPVPLRSG